MALIKIVSKAIGSNIRRIRQDLGMSQEEFGKVIGMDVEEKFPKALSKGKKKPWYSQDSVTKWESGQVPHAVVLIAIAHRAHCSVDSILGVGESPPKSINYLLLDIRRNINRIEELDAAKKPKRPIKK